MSVRTNRTTVAIAFLLAALAGCNGGRVSDEEEAMWAYVGLDGAVERALKLGITGFNEAASANIPAQEEAGDVGGTLTVTGQVDQGSSDNKELRLLLSLVEYQDDTSDLDISIVYDTEMSALPELDISLRDIPDGTLEGTLLGAFFMAGDLEGQVTLALDLSGTIREDPNDATLVERIDGATTITGTATSDYGTYDIDVIR